MEEKTNAIRILESHKCEYIYHIYETEKALSAEEISEKLNIERERVFKTLVTVAPSKKNYVFLVPAQCELDLKKAAASVKEKSLSMVKQDTLFPLTGYVHGGCSPIGMKKQFVTVIDKSAENFEKIVFSAGKIGRQVEMSLDELKKAIKFSLFPVSKEK